MFGKLESLRGVAACFVILYHSPFNFSQEPLGFFNNSYLFVDFFFILSGFVMSFAYGEKILQKLSFKKYIILRIGRIYPLHLFFLLVWLPYVLIKQYLYINGYGGTDQFDTSNFYTFFSNLFLIHSMGLHNDLSWNFPSWSISTEFFAYIAFFLFTHFLDRKKSIIIPLLISIACYIFIFNIEYKNLDITYDYGFFRCLGAFYIGVFLFRLKLKNIKELPDKWILPLEIFSIILIIYTVSNSNNNTLFLILTIISFALTIFIFSSNKSGFLGKILESTFMRRIGIQSYSIYMLLGIVWAIILNLFVYLFKINPEETFGISSIVINIFVISIIIFLSKYTYLYIEKNIRDIVKKKVAIWK